jgi:beta-ribofuranosylaminobenzene 5'-phosphate synthase
MANCKSTLKNNMLKITTPLRIHITLIGLGARGYRRNGGIGFFLNTPSAEFHFEATPKIDLSLLNIHGFHENEIFKMENRISNLMIDLNCTHGISLKHAILPPRHFGFGAGTATMLSTVEAVSILNDRLLTNEELIRQSGRGGTSGIGVHGYFSGGFLFDVGHQWSTQEYLSSDDISSPHTIPLLFSNVHMPNWPIGLFIPNDIKFTPIEKERTLFKNTLPLLDSEVYETAYHSIFGIAAAVVDHNFKDFCDAINILQFCAWKRAEISLHGDRISTYMKELRNLGCTAVGMSSVGPLLYFFSNDFDTIVEEIRKKLPNGTILISSPNNTGRAIEKC